MRGEGCTHGEWGDATRGTWGLGRGIGVCGSCVAQVYGVRCGLCGLWTVVRLRGASAWCVCVVRVRGACTVSVEAEGAIATVAEFAHEEALHIGVEVLVQ